MKELNERIEFYEMTAADPQILVWLLELRRHREDNWKQRAEAAEAKLAGLNDEAAHERNLRSKFETDCKVLQAKLAVLEKQEPVAYVHPAYLQAGALGFDASVGRLAPAQIPLFTRPTPAAAIPNLSPVRNCLAFFASAIKSGESWSATCQRDLDAARRALRDAEEAK